MRLSAWFLGVMAFVALIGATALCSVLSFGAVRQGVIDLQGSGILLDSPGQLVAAITGNLDAETESAPTFAVPTQSESVIVIPSVTPPPQTTPIVNAPTSAAILNATPDVMPTATPTVTVIAPETLAQNNAADLAAQYRWDDPRQQRILLMGIDQRRAIEDDGPFRTDTMILVNVDPVRKQAGVVSFPRDLWVRIPGINQQSRINTANYHGDLNAYPGGGPALAMETIANNFGIRVDKYVLINFDVFETTVDTLAPDGVEICVREVIDDPDYPDAGYGTIYVRFDPGCQNLDATRLLQYARTRATEGGDFDRAQRQQEVLDALRAKLLSVGGVANFVTQIPILWEQLSGNYETNLTPDDIIRLGFLANEIPAENIEYAVINENYVNLDTTETGDQILVPIPSRINDLFQRVLFQQAPASLADLRTQAEAERAQIYVYNGTDIAGLAGSTREWLTGRGVTVVGVGNDTNHNGAPTVIKDYGGTHGDTARYLAQLLNVPLGRIQPGTDGLIANGVMVVAGPDIQPLLGGGG